MLKDQKMASSNNREKLLHKCSDIITKLAKDVKIGRKYRDKKTWFLKKDKVTVRLLSELNNSTSKGLGLFTWLWSVTYKVNKISLGCGMSISFRSSFWLVMNDERNATSLFYVTPFSRYFMFTRKWPLILLCVN